MNINYIKNNDDENKKDIKDIEDIKEEEVIVEDLKQYSIFSEEEELEVLDKKI